MKSPVEKYISQSRLCSHRTSGCDSGKYRHIRKIHKSFAHAVKYHSQSHAGGKRNGDPRQHAHIRFYIFASQTDLSDLTESGPEAENQQSKQTNIIKPAKIICYELK